MPRVMIDGEIREVPAGATVLDALRSVGVEVPTLCHDDRVRPQSVCRMCVVEWGSHLVAACSTVVLDGMVLRTKSPRIDAARHTAQMLLDQRKRDTWVDDSHPYIKIDMSLCIDCRRCVRICDEVQGQSVWHVFGRGAEIRVRPDGPTLAESSCVACGACVTTCPTNALTDHGASDGDASTRTTCPYCGVGCELDVRTSAGRIVRVLPVLDAPVNKGHLCSKGRYAFGFVASDDRLTVPLVRERGQLASATWSDATTFIAKRLRDIVDRHGPGSVGVLGSARATNEENYVAQKFARVALGTNNVDCCARVCHAPSAKALGMMLGTGAATSSYDDIERARTIMVSGANATEAHPIVGARIRRCARAGANLIVVDPRRIELARVPGALHLRVRPGANVLVFHAMASAILEERLADESFLRERVDGLEAYRALVARHRPEDVADACGVPAPLIREAARRYARETPSICFHGLGLTEHEQGTEGVMALINLALLTGNVGKPGTGVNPLRGQNNVQGAANMGCEPSRLTGYAALDAAADPFEAAWNVRIPRAPGLSLMEMIDAAARGRLRALWVMGYDVLLTNPEQEKTREALAKLDLLVVQDIFMNETARLAHVVLPSACSFEKDGTFMNAERRVQRVRKAIDAPGEARTDWEPLCDVARALGSGGFEFRSAEAIWDEVRTVWPAVRGITYARLEQGGLQWPCPHESHPGTTLLHTTSFTSGPRATLRAIEPRDPPERTSPAHPFVLVTGRSLYQFNAGTMTMRTKNRQLRPTDTLDMCPDDASRLGLAEGARVRVRSHHGETVLPLHIDARVAPGELFATFCDPKARVNVLIGPHRDNLTDTPDYKVTAVSVEPA